MRPYAQRRALQTVTPRAERATDHSVRDMLTPANMISMHPGVWSGLAALLWGGGAFARALPLWHLGVGVK